MLQRPGAAIGLRFKLNVLCASGKWKATVDQGKSSNDWSAAAALLAAPHLRNAVLSPKLDRYLMLQLLQLISDGTLPEGVTAALMQVQVASGRELLRIAIQFNLQLRHRSNRILPMYFA